MASKKDGTEVLGSGMARKAADTIKEAKKKKKSRLEIAVSAARKARGSK